MKNGTTILFKTTKEFLAEHKWYERVVYKTIGFCTGKPYDHCGQILDGMFYESGHPFGFSKKPFKLKTGERYEYHEPITDFTKEEIYNMVEYWEEQIRQNTRYNHRKLLALAIIHPMHKFWDWLQWVPFQNNFLWGAVCSVALYEAFVAANIILLPGRYKETIAPGDYKDSKILKQLEI